MTLQEGLLKPTDDDAQPVAPSSNGATVVPAGIDVLPASAKDVHAPIDDDDPLVEPTIERRAPRMGADAAMEAAAAVEPVLTTSAVAPAPRDGPPRAAVEPAFSQPMSAPVVVPDEEFENQKTTELSAALGVPPPISLGPRAPIIEQSSLERGLDAVTQALAGALPDLPIEPPPPQSLYDDTPLPVPPSKNGLSAALDEKTADIIVPRLALRGATDHGSDDSSKLPTDEGATVEGAPVDDHAQRTDVGPLPPVGGEVMTADDGKSVVKLEDSLGEQAGMVFYRARISVDGVDLGQPFTAVWMPQAPPEPPWSHLPDARLVRPRCRVTLDRAAVRVFERPKGNTVVDYLADDERLLPAMATIELGLELAELLESLHGAGCCLYDLDPSQIVIEKGGRVRLYAVSGLYPAGQLPPGALGIFCAPEVRRRMSYRVGTSSDVYAAALLIYALLAKRAPLDTDTDPALLATPRVFRPECPLGIWPYLKPCLDPNPARRIGHARGLRQQLELARGRLIAEARATEEQVPVMLEGWAEQHAGLAKARRGSGQQDRALSVTDETGKTGLYLISDGVSRSRFGDGAFAAEQVEWAALQRWTGLEKAGPQALELEHPQRADILKQISRSAGKKIAAEINAKYAPIPNEPNQVMSATLVAAFVVNGDATLGNLGDSRAYLVRDGVIEQVCVDHDRCTDALRLGLSFREAAHVQMGTALTRVVGRVVIDEDGTCRPDPFEPELFRLRLLPGDRLVLCSDGVADFAAGAGAPQAEQDAKIKETVITWEDPGRAAFELVVLANRAGGYDNISCVVLAVHPG
ncbi:MAG: serine/threonine-protein phosphatase [Deltaproteobacteria bacterium]|nr:serine/threonine-protein phosphatase [Deltaproteobacteria bacterium]